MTEMTQNFVSLLFNPGESICVSPNKYGYHSVEQEDLNGEISLISPKESIAPKAISESDINLIALNPIKGYRRDENVTAYRTFLVEIDTGPLEEQKKYIEESGLPYSVCIFSGNKSLHYGIVLDEDLPSLSVWRWCNKWILNILTQADQQVKNPSRSIRFPGNKRHDGKQLIQAMVDCQGRVKKADFFNWLGKHEDKKPRKEKKIHTGDFIIGMPDFTKIPPDVAAIYQGGVSDNRNATWFYIGCRLAKIGFNDIQAINFLEQYFQEESDFKRREWETCLKSAYKRVIGESL